MKTVLLFLTLALFPLSVSCQVDKYVQVRTTIDLAGSYDFTNTVAYQYPFSKSYQGKRGGYRFGMNMSVRVSEKILFKTGFRHSRQGHIIDIRGPTIDVDYQITGKFKGIFLDEYYIEIPVMFRYEIDKKRHAYFVELGFSPHFYLGGKEVYEFANYTVANDFEIHHMKGVRWRMAYILGIGLNYNLNSKNQIFIQPTFRFYPPTRNEPITPFEITTEETRNVGVEFGVRRVLSFVKGRI